MLHLFFSFSPIYLANLYIVIESMLGDRVGGETEYLGIELKMISAFLLMLAVAELCN